MYKELLRPPFVREPVYEGQRLVDLQRREIQRLRSGETLRVACGEIRYDVLSQWQKDLRAAQRRHVRIRMLGGPIIEVKNGDNPIFKLVRDGTVQLHVSNSRRQKDNYQIFGERKLCNEVYQECLLPLEEKAGFLTGNPIAISPALYQFESHIEIFNFPLCEDPKKALLCLETEQIRALQERVRGTYYDFDFLCREDIESLLAHPEEVVVSLLSA